jgi:hypothetical protein
VRAKRPHWPLERIKALVAADSIHIHGKVNENFSSPKEARTRTKEVCMSLTVAQFAETVALTWDTADVYGVRFREGGWYLKLTIDEEIPEAVCISFHPLKFSLRTNSGEVKP